MLSVGGRLLDGPIHPEPSYPVRRQVISAATHALPALVMPSFRGSAAGPLPLRIAMGQLSSLIFVPLAMKGLALDTNLMLR